MSKIVQHSEELMKGKQQARRQMNDKEAGIKYGSDW